MPSLKDLKNRIGSVKNTQKITKAMKMVAAAKLRRAREAAEAARPYAERLGSMVQSLSAGIENADHAPLLMRGTGKSNKHLIIVATADRGLCGAFNSSIVRSVRQKIRSLQAEGKEVRLFCVGRKGYDMLKGEYGSLVDGRAGDISRKIISYETAETISEQIIALYENDSYDVCWVVYNHFKSVISQIVTWQQLIPLSLAYSTPSTESRTAVPYEYEPDEATILADLLPRNLSMQVFKSLLENAASEQGARMSAMDNATRNAGDMIKRLTLQYNRSRQAAITKELIEIISGAEAV
jgi:F-type H+-transporting ATPase subunit gamma